jgi:predicted O-linked N-acetylglucosamine transferase (SPINDLY family)
MVSAKDLELKLQDLYKKKKYSEIIFQITSRTTEEERNAGLFVLLGISRMSLGLKDKNQVSLAVQDFKKGYLKDSESVGGLNALTNFVLTSSILSDFENTNVDFDEIKSFYQVLPKHLKDQRPINIAMSTIYSRLSDYKGMVFHIEKIIKSKEFIAQDLCNYGYWRCFDKNWTQSKFLEFGQFVNENLSEYSQKDIVPLSDKKNEKIRVGFLSADINGSHSINYFLKTVLENYDKKNFEIILFTNRLKDEKTAERITNLASKTIDVGKLDNLRAFNTIRKFNLDIMIDIMGYTSRNRIEFYKNRLAKKQVIWMGYCNTSGLENMDYIITDPNLIYENEKNLYSEKVIYLPEIWNCHCGFDFERKENPPPFINNKYFTFGSFNSFNKINPDVVNVWSNILKRVSKSKLVLKTSHRNHALKRLKNLFEKNDVLESIQFIGRQEDLKHHLITYNDIDIALDTFPYNGVTTSFEATWMGVPVITMAGYNFNSRCGESINKNLNMERMVAKDEEDYVNKVVDLSNNHEDYINLRKSIFLNALKSPLFNVQNYCKSFFEALEGIVN